MKRICWVIACLAVTTGPAWARPAHSDTVLPTKIHPAALGDLIEELGGRQVLVTDAVLIAVLNPQTLLLESTGKWLGLPPMRGRVLVQIEHAKLNVRPELSIGYTVRVLGTARTVLGAQAAHFVPWPAVLTPDAIRRYDIKAVVVASSVKTADGIELTTPE